MDYFKTVSDDKENLVGETVYYRGWITDSGIILADTSDQVDSEGNPLANHEIVQGISIKI